MKQIFSILSFTLLMFLFSCKTDSLSGVYACDESKKKANTSTNEGDFGVVSIDMTCVFREFDFKGKNTVAISTASGQIISSYVIDDEYVRIKGTGSDFLLKRNGNTLTGEGIVKGTYHKKQ